MTKQTPPWELSHGARPDGPERSRFRVWAPRVQRLEVIAAGDLAQRWPLERNARGWFEGHAPLRDGDDYLYRLDGGQLRPDPSSRWQPEGVHGPSRIVAAGSFPWTDAAWRGLPLAEYVFYELHVGTFTPEGSFDAVIPRLAALAELGVSAIELMPVAEFPGARNWGYDGVQLYAPQSSYGGPDGLKRLVDAIHGHGMAAVLDVVYNHLGPEGNVLHSYGPYFTDAYRTPWGEALNFDGADSDEVRQHVVDNARYWFAEYHLDALRLDAVHGIYDLSARHLLAELADAADDLARQLDRPCWLIAESDLNDARVIQPRARGGHGVHAQWSDDFQRALYSLLTGSRRGYLVDFGQTRQLAKALAQGYVFDGQVSSYRRRRHGNRPEGCRAEQFVVYVQNHDQVANTSQGTRLVALTDRARARLAITVQLCAANLPLLFMGEEYAETRPFHYFIDHGDAELIEAVRQGRQREHHDVAGGQPFLDPQDPATFEASKLNWSCREQSHHGEMLALYRTLLQLRRSSPALATLERRRVAVASDDDGRWLTLLREAGDGDRALLVASFGEQARQLPLTGRQGKMQRVLWTGDEKFGGPGGAGPAEQVDSSASELELGPWEAAIYLSADATGAL